MVLNARLICSILTRRRTASQSIDTHCSLLIRRLEKRSVAIQFQAFFTRRYSYTESVLNACTSLPHRIGDVVIPSDPVDPTMRLADKGTSSPVVLSPRLVTRRSRRGYERQCFFPDSLLRKPSQPSSCIYFDKPLRFIALFLIMHCGSLLGRDDPGSAGSGCAGIFLRPFPGFTAT